ARITPPLRVVPWKSAEASSKPASRVEIPAPGSDIAAINFQRPYSVSPAASNRGLGDSAQSFAPSNDISIAIAIVWALGTLILVGRLARAHIVARRVVKHSYLTRQPNIERVPVRFSADVELPFTYGLRNPVIVLPSDADSWDEAQMKATLMHEAAHAKRADGVALLVTQLIVALYWWHPIVWVAARAAAADRERACDDAVLREGMRASDYGQCLLAHADTMAAWKSSPLATVMFGHSAGIGSRVAALLDPAIDRSSGARPKLIVVAGVVGLVVLVGAAAPQNLESAGDVGMPPAVVTQSVGRAATARANRPALVTASIVPVANFAPASSDATVCRQAKDWHQARTYRDAAVHIQGAGATFNGGVTREIWTGVDCIAWLQFNAQVVARADEKNMVVTGNGRFIAHNEGPDGTREYTLTSNSSGLTLNGSTTAIGPSESEWIAGMTREYLRRTGTNIHNRARRALASGGIPALLAEAASVPRGNICAQYLAEGFASTLNARETARFIHAGAALLDSLDSRVPFLTAVPVAYLNNPEVLEAIYAEASVIEPDGAVEAIVAKTDPPRPLSTALRPWMEKIIAGISTSERRAALSAYYLGTKP
ncbi:MAG: M56 family metallopeptidase, partial [Gemmatimonadales bacterium]